MYAKLVFNTNTEIVLAVRDIVRAIVNSDGLGGSTLGALENVDVANSSIDDTVASGWSLAAGQSISTGAAVEQDKAFYLQATHSNTSTKTVRLGSGYRDASGFTNANGTTYSGVVVGPVLDYGETYQEDVGFPSDSATVSTTTAVLRRVNPSKPLYVIATPKSIVIVGTNTGHAGGGKYQAIIELDATHENTVGRNRPAQVLVCGANQRLVSNVSYANSASTGFSSYTSTNHFSASYPQIIHQVFTDAFYDYSSSEEIRLAAIASQQTMTTPAQPSGVTPASDFESVVIYRDTGNANGYGTPLLNSNTPYSVFFGGNTGEGWPGMTAASICGWYGFFREDAYINGLHEPNDSAGVRTNKLHSLAVTAGMGVDQVNYTVNGGMYRGTGLFPGETVEIVDGSDIYIGCKVGHNYGPQGAVWFKAV